MPASASLTVLGVDTALRVSGVGVIDASGNRNHVKMAGIVKNPANRLHSACMLNIFDSISELIEEFKPDAVAVEGVFHFRNSRTAVILGQARGCVLAAAARFGVPVYEYSPRRIKQAVVGTGSAGKEQVAHMIMSILGLKELPQSDAADALAVALCHIHACAHPAIRQQKQI